MNKIIRFDHFLRLSTCTLTNPLHISIHPSHLHKTAFYAAMLSIFLFTIPSKNQHSFNKNSILQGMSTSTGNALTINTPENITGSPLKNAFGINGFEWDFVNEKASSRIINPVKFEAVKNFTAFRHYQDWQQIEQSENAYSFNPTRSGGWNYDIIYEACKKANIDVLVCMQSTPQWLANSYPENIRSRENIPVRYPHSFTKPMSYIEKARAGFQLAARYGQNKNIANGLLPVNTIPRWSQDPPNEIKKGLGTVKYIECCNEPDKWWKGLNACQSPEAFAACLSAFYDGHKNTMGKGVGVKNADPKMLVVMGGLASHDPQYVKDMIEWCRQYRGYRSPGKIDLCWDIINYHMYTHDDGGNKDSHPTRGIAPEKSIAAKTAQDFIKISHQYANDIPVWVTEAGYDQHPGSPQKAITIGNKSIEQTQADWIIRTALLYKRSGIDKVFFYQLLDANISSPARFSSMGLIDKNFKRKIAADYIYQISHLIGQYQFVATLNNDPLIDEYDFNGKKAWVALIPDEIGRKGNYILSTGNISAVNIYFPTPGNNQMKVVKKEVKDGKVNIEVTETPVFILPAE